MNKVSFPHMGNYWVAFRPLANLFGGKIIIAPKITQKTLELGAKHSPESACVPFKYNLGNFIEALELGANILIQAGGGCRFGYYAEVQEKILKKLGYRFKMIKFSHNYQVLNVLKTIRQANPKAKLWPIVSAFFRAYFKLRAIDQSEAVIRSKMALVKDLLGMEKAYEAFLKDLDQAETLNQIFFEQKKILSWLADIPVKKSTKLLKVAIVGEVYVVMESFSNFFLEKELAKFGIQTTRFVDLSSVVHHALSGRRHIKEHLLKANKYLKYHIGAHGTESVAKTLECIEGGYDGVIHIKPFGCMPEVNAMSMLHRISKDYQFPIIYFSFDALTSQTGIKTRLEAFYDMLQMKKKKKI